jgi:hypothetical protein
MECRHLGKEIRGALRSAPAWWKAAPREDVFGQPPPGSSPSMSSQADAVFDAGPRGGGDGDRDEQQHGGEDPGECPLHGR